MTTLLGSPITGATAWHPVDLPPTGLSPTELSPTELPPTIYSPVAIQSESPTFGLRRPDPGRTQPSIDIVLPVYNEERVLAANVRRLRRYVDVVVPFATVITIADNASTDGTWEVAGRLAATVPGVRAVHLDRKGRGRALRQAWSASEAEVVAYMDIDLSTDLDALLPLVAPLLTGDGQVAIGSRLAQGAQVVRGPKREIISRAYNLLIKATMRSRFSDAQCGFKAIRRDTAAALLPLVEDNEWFFDTELLLLAEHNDVSIHEVPVHWTDDPDSRVRLVSTAAKDLKGLVRMTFTFAAGRGIMPPPR
jgi:glycosyltransferase involved in cell wall biosynthesis